MPGTKGAVFGFDKYHEPALLSRKDTIAHAILDACFMVPGNLPTLPHIGVNIRQYFYKEQSAISTEKIKADLEQCCGQSICGATIESVDFSTQKIANNEYIFLLILVIRFSPTDKELLGITMKQTQDNYVNFNFEYVPMDNQY